MTGRLAAACLAAAGLLALPAGALGLSGNGKIAFASNGHIYIVEPATGAETDLGSGVSPAWSPDGTRLAFLDFGVTVMNADGSGRRQLHTGGLDRRPVWSPDGTRLAFGSGSSGVNGSLIVVDVASGDARVVVPTGVQLDWLPSWSPNGTKLAFTEGTGVDLAVVGADGSGHRLLIGGSGIDAAPAWSPDGTKIAFLHSVAGDPSLHVIPTRGDAEPRRLTDTMSWPSSFYGPPAWSPDGSQVAFTGSQILAYNRGGPIVSSAVHVIDAEGTLERRLTRAGDVPGYHNPSWSPDGRRILFEGSGGSYMNTDGTCETRVSERPASSLTWQPAATPPAPLLRCADLELTVSQGRTAVEAGGEETFTLDVKNLENETATGIRLQAGAPVGGSFVSVSTSRGTCSLDGEALSCSVGELPVGEVMAVTLTTRATSLGPVHSTARASALQLDGNQANNVRALSIEALPCTMVAPDAGGRLLGTKRADTLCGRAGQDLILGLAGNDEIDAGMGADRVFPGPGRDVVHLRAGADFADTRDGAPRQDRLRRRARSRPGRPGRHRCSRLRHGGEPPDPSLQEARHDALGQDRGRQRAERLGLCPVRSRRDPHPRRQRRRGRG
jgi:Tol biopolymer transport system component